MDDNTRTILEEMVAQRLLEVVSQDDLETSYYEMQLEWAETLSEEHLIEIAADLRVEIPTHG